MEQPEPSDEDLATRAGRGDAAAFDVLVRGYGARLLGYLSRSCAIPASEVEDLAQDVWLKVWRALPTWQPNHFRGWLFTVARNIARDFAPRRVRLSHQVPLADVPEPVADLGDAETGPDPEDLARLERCLEELKKRNPEFHSVFVGHASGKLYQVLAVELGVEIGTIKSRLSRAREVLRRCLGRTDP
jgi:RNA polymerase sigma-70 factor (ECF subfamily)